MCMFLVLPPLHEAFRCKYMSFFLYTQYNQEYNELFREAGLPPKRRLMQMRVSPCAKIQPGKLPAGKHT